MSSAYFKRPAVLLLTKCPCFWFGALNMLCCEIGQHECGLCLNFLLGFRLYSQLEEVKRQKESRSRQESYAKNREKARDFQRVRRMTSTRTHYTRWWWWGWSRSRDWRSLTNAENTVHIDIKRKNMNAKHFTFASLFISLLLEWIMTWRFTRIIRHDCSVLCRCGHDETCDAPLSLLQKTLEKLRAKLKPWRLQRSFCVRLNQILKSQALLFVCLYVVYSK